MPRPRKVAVCDGRPWTAESDVRLEYLFNARTQRNPRDFDVHHAWAHDRSPEAVRAARKRLGLTL